MHGGAAAGAGGACGAGGEGGVATFAANAMARAMAGCARLEELMHNDDKFDPLPPLAGSAVEAAAGGESAEAGRGLPCVYFRVSSERSGKSASELRRSHGIDMDKAQRELARRVNADALPLLLVTVTVMARVRVWGSRARRGAPSRGAKGPRRRTPPAIPARWRCWQTPKYEGSDVVCAVAPVGVDVADTWRLLQQLAAGILKRTFRPLPTCRCD